VICVGVFVFGVCSVFIGSVSFRIAYIHQLIKLRVTHRKHRDQESQAQKVSFFMTFLNTAPKRPLNTSAAGNRFLNPLKLHRSKT